MGLQYFHREAFEINGCNLKRWNTYSFDTNATKRNIRKLITKADDLEHAHYTTFDSYNQRLIFKDLIWPGKDMYGRDLISVMQYFDTGPVAISSHFLKAAKQLQYLHTVQ